MLFHQILSRVHFEKQNYSRKAILTTGTVMTNLQADFRTRLDCVESLIRLNALLTAGDQIKKNI